VYRGAWAFWWDNSKVLSEDSLSGMADRRWWGVKVLGLSLAKGLFFVGLPPALLGLWRFREPFRTPGGWMLMLFAGMVFVALYRVAVVIGYMSERHLLLVTMLLCFWAAAGMIVAGRWLAAWRCRPQSADAWGLGLLLLLCAGPAIRTLAPLHAERAGFRQAGYWLAQHAQPGDRLIDPYSWASYYSGRVFQEGPPAHASSVRYVVVEESANNHSHLVEVEEAKKLAQQAGAPVCRWDLKRGKVVIYKLAGE
jgi:hypothetical protein